MQTQLTESQILYLSLSYHSLAERKKLDRRRLEAAHLLYAALQVCHWYPDILPALKIHPGELDSALAQIVSQYHTAFSNYYSGKMYLVLYSFTSCLINEVKTLSVALSMSHGFSYIIPEADCNSLANTLEIAPRMKNE